MADKLRFNLGEENGPVIEKNISKSELFAEQYKMLCSAISEYLCLPDNYEQSKLSSNIFAINGDRGFGKTSVMHSMVNYLKNSDTYFGFANCQCGNYFCLDVIDPSFLDNQSNVLQIIIAQLYKSFKDKCSKSADISFENKNDLLRLFSNVNRNLQCINSISNGNFHCDELESLELLSSSVDLKKTMQELIQRFLKFQNKKYLLISIDDIDLNTEHAYVMVEQLRKYLVMPEVVVLMAVKIKQLQFVLRKYFVTEFGNLLSNKGVKINDIDQMVEKYILKLIPLEHRINLYDIAAKFNKELIVVKNKEEKNLGLLRLAIPKLIFEKTGYLFYNSKNQINYIIPRNLREMRLLLKLLYNLEDKKEEYNGYNNREHNQLIFKNYFFNTWVPNNLEGDNLEIVESINSVDNAAVYNKTIIELLKQKFYSIKKDKKPIDENIERILNVDNKYYNISLGDVLALMYHIQTSVINESTRLLLFAIKTMYSMRLYDAYNDMTTETNLRILLTRIENIAKNQNQKNASEDGGVELGDYLADLTDYQSLLGGNAINSQYFDFLPSPKGSDQSRSYHKFSIDRPLNSNNPADILVMLLTMYNWKTKKADEGYAYRVRKELYYRRNLGLSKDFCFDMMVWTYNVPFIFETLQRFNVDVSNVFQDKYITHIESSNFTLFNWLSGEILKLEGETDTLHIDDYYKGTNVDDRVKRLHRWLSYTCIRNIDILENILNKYMDEINEIKGKEPHIVFRRLYNRVLKNKISVYKENSSSFPDLQLSGLQLILSLLQYSSKYDYRTFDLMINGNTSDNVDDSKQMKFSFTIPEKKRKKNVIPTLRFPPSDSKILSINDKDSLFTYLCECNSDKMELIDMDAFNALVDDFERVFGFDKFNDPIVRKTMSNFIKQTYREKVRNK